MFPAMQCLSRSGLRSVPRSAAIRAFVLPATLAVLSFGIPRAWATAASTTTTLTVTVSGSAVTSVAAGTVVTLTATVVSGSTPVNPGTGEVLRRNGRPLRRLGLARNGAVDHRRGGPVQIQAGHWEPTAIRRSSLAPPVMRRAHRPQPR